MRVLDQWIYSQPSLTRFAQDFLDIHPVESSLYLVGGLVRDVLLNLDTSDKDYDLMVEQSTEENLAKSLATLKSNGRIRTFFKVGKSFPVYKIQLLDRTIEMDLALARKERSTGIGHSQFEVESSGITAFEDARRRDFTVNALFVRFFPKQDGIGWNLIDSFEGQSDLKKRTLRAVGNAKDRMSEDPLRILRAIRFVHQKGFRLEDSLKKVILSRGGEWIPTVSPDRIQEEFLKTMVVDLWTAYENYLHLNLLDAAFPKLKPFLPDKAELIPENSSLKENLSEDLVFPILLTPWLAGVNFLPPSGALRNLEEILRSYHIPSPRRTRTLLANLCSLFCRDATPYPRSIQEKILNSPTGKDCKVLYETFYAQCGLPELDSLTNPPPRIPGQELISWGFKPSRGLERIVLHARELQWQGTLSMEEIKTRLLDQFSNET